MLSSFWDEIKERVLTMILFRPVGQREFELIAQSGYKEFPPRLPEQPIFYPVLTQKYAEEIAEKWNAKDSFSGYKGYVTRFEIEDSYISGFDVQQVGDTYHLEYWIPAEELSNFNKHIIGLITVIKGYK
jgi:hypothetical protein